MYLFWEASFYDDRMYKKVKEVYMGENNGHKIKILKDRTIWKHKTEDWSSTVWEKGNLGQWVFIPVLDHNKSLVTPVYLNEIVAPLFRC